MCDLDQSPSTPNPPSATAVCRTVERIVFDSVFVEPVRTRDGEDSGRRSIEWTDRARSVARRLIDDEVQGTGALRRRKGVDHFESPVADVAVGEEELVDGGEVGGVSTCEIVEDDREHTVADEAYRKTRHSQAGWSD